MQPHRSFGKSRVCRTGNEPVADRVHPNIRAPPRSTRSGWLARVCDAPCGSQTGPNLGDRTEGDHVGVMPDMTEPVCSNMHAAPRPARQEPDAYRCCRSSNDGPPPFSTSRLRG